MGSKVKATETFPTEAYRSTISRRRPRSFILLQSPIDRPIIITCITHEVRWLFAQCTFPIYAKTL